MTDDSHQKPAAPAPPLRRWFLLLAVVVVLLYLAGLNPYWRFQRDSALYMGLARSLAQHGTYSFNGHPHTFAFPGFPAMLSLVYLTLGQSFLAMNALVSLFGLGCIALAYLLYRELVLTPAQTLACMLLLGFSRTLYYYSSHIITDVPFAFFVAAALYLGRRALRADGRARWGWWLAASGAALAACTVRPLGPALLIALVAALWLQPGARAQWRRRALMTGLLLAPILLLGGLWARRGAGLGVPLGSTYFSQFIVTRGPEGVGRHLLSRLPDLAGALSDPVLGSDVGTTIGLLLAFLLVLGFRRALRDGERLLCTFGLVYVPAILLVGPGRRYLLPLLPVLLYWIVLGAGELGSYLERRGTATPARLRRVGHVLLALAVLGNLAHLSKTLYEARSPNFYAVTADGRMLDYFPLTDWLRQHAGPRDLVFTGEANVVRYFSGVRTIQLPDLKLVRRPRVQAYFLRRHRPTYVIIDHTESRPERSLAGLPPLVPDALERVGTFGKLELFRVHGEKL